jgi:DNA-binding PadR family transcriptional regulator
MYELIILSLLMNGPLHGYLIAKITNDIIGPWAKVSNGTLYPLLAKLEKSGYIAIATGGSDQRQGERIARTFEITDDGRKRFHKLMMDTSSNPGEYQKFFQLKVAYLFRLQPMERLHLLDHYINYCQTHILYSRSEAKEFVEITADQDYMPTARMEGTLEVFEHIIDYWQAELKWVQNLRAKEVARIESNGEQLIPEITLS